MSMAKLLYQGHGSYRITAGDGTTVYVDPYAGEGYDAPADLVLITHEHVDHTNVDLVHQKPGCQIWREADMLTDGEYQTRELDGIVVRAVPAYNLKHKRDDCVGYVIVVDGVRIYGSGDTSTTSCMMEVLPEEDLDYALLCIDGVFNMNPEEATQCAEMISAHHAIPIHMKPGALFDEAMAARFTPANRLILRPGDEMGLEHI